MAIIDEVKQKADIVDIISQYGVRLDKMGKNLKAQCPFHSEKHASFFVFPEQQRWHCFGACATGGDVFAFVMRKEGVDFGHALRILADKVGVRLTEASKAEDSERERLYELNALAAEHYHHLLTGTAAGDMARSYLEKRGVTSWGISAFQLGFSLDRWDGLAKHAMAKGFTEKALLASGLAVEREGGGSYDRFRGRLMFPIRDGQGRVTGFGGRSLDGSDPKYMNSPQTLVFDKSGTLYGIDRGRTAIRTQGMAVIVEGYMDVIMAHQHGFENVVASMGTSLTERQASILKKLAKRLTLALDADAAGAEATLRGIQVLNESLDRKIVPVPTQRGSVRFETAVDAEIGVVMLPLGVDPDELIRADPAAWTRLIETAIPVTDYVLKVTASRLDLAQVQGRSELVSRVLPVLREIRDPVRQAHYLQKLAQLAKVRDQDLWSTLQAGRAPRTRNAAAAPRPAPVLSSPVEDYCLALLLQYPDLKSCCADLAPDYFEDTAGRELFVLLTRCDDPAHLKDGLDAGLAETLERLLAKALPPANASQRRHHISDCVLTLKERWLRNLEARKGLAYQEAAQAAPEAQLQKVQELGTSVPQRLRELFHEPRGKQRLRPRPEHNDPSHTTR